MWMLILCIFHAVLNVQWLILRMDANESDDEGQKDPNPGSEPSAPAVMGKNTNGG